MNAGRVACVAAFLAIVCCFPARGTDLADPIDRFNLPPPAPRQLGATRSVRISPYFAMELIPDRDAAIPLLDAHGRALGPRLAEVQFCDAAMEGAVIIGGATYSVTGTGRERQANCKRVFSRFARRHPVSADALGRSRFARADTRFGLGVHGLRLVPGRTIATDPGFIETGTALYIPALRSTRVSRDVLHDGYVFAADVSDNIRADHVAWFAGLRGSAAPTNPPPVQSTTAAAERVQAQIIADPAIVAALERAHRLP